MSERERESLKKLLARALNKNQILVLSEINQTYSTSVSSFLSSLSTKQNIPLSTLKVNAKILKRLGLVEFSANNKPIATQAGRFVLGKLKDRKVEFRLLDEKITMISSRDVEKDISQFLCRYYIFMR